jgi:hypothetical protein
MSKPFEVPRLDKYEDWVDQQICDTVYEIITEFYGVEDPNELTLEQINSIEEWAEKNDPFYLGPRFREVIDDWKYENEET